MTAEKHITLSELLADVKRTLSEHYPFGVWICAEIGELKENRYSGHCYLELIEKGEREGTPKAKASAAIWRSRWTVIANYFREATGAELGVGMKVLLKVGVTFHEAYGFSLVVSDIDPTYTLGESQRRRQETIAALTADGVMELNGELPFPRVAQRIAIISSKTAAGLRDFMTHISESGYRFEVTLFEALMQGMAAEESIIAALDRVAEREREFDLVAIIRGGGAQSDMECFNSYALCSNIAQFPLPILTGIGHDKDSSVADMVAARALKTPTAVADMLISLAEGFLTEAEGIYGQITGIAAHTLAMASSTLQLHSARLASSSAAQIADRRLLLESTNLQLRHSIERLLDAHRLRLQVAESSAEASSPERILRMGFAMVRSEGKTITDASLLSEGERVEIVLRNGSATATITTKQKTK